jgi:hypothetical protein
MAGFEAPESMGGCPRYRIVLGGDQRYQKGWEH